MPPFRCQGEANPFIEHYFYDCIYNARDAAGFTFGMASIACWIFAQVPQFITNWKRQRADALSPWFLAEWLLGDTCNLIGCLMTGNQLATVTYTATYFIFADTCLITQYIYFQALQHRRERFASIPTHRLRPDDPLYRHAVRRPASVTEDVRAPLDHSGSSSGRSSPSSARLLACVVVMLIVQSQWSLQPQISVSSIDGSMLTSTRHLLGADVLADNGPHRPEWVRHVGTIIGWSSSGFYLGSRLSQIWKNYSRGSAEGLSLAMFACAITANVCYGLGIILRAYSWEVVWSSAPWLLGSLGTVSLDLVIFTQGLMYAPKQHVSEEVDRSGESQPLVHEQSRASSA